MNEVITKYFVPSLTLSISFDTATMQIMYIIKKTFIVQQSCVQKTHLNVGENAIKSFYCTLNCPIIKYIFQHNFTF